MTTEHEFTGTIEVTFTIKAACRITGFGPEPEAARADAIREALLWVHSRDRFTPGTAQAFWESPEILNAELDEDTVRETEFRDGSLRYL